VKVSRAGLRLRFRSGYHAVPDLESAEQRHKAELAGAVASPIDATAVPMDVSLETSRAMTAGERAVVVTVDGGALTFKPSDKGLVCLLNVFVVQKSADGTQLEGSFDNVSLAVTEARAQQLRERGYTHRKIIKLSSTAAIVRVVVRNSATGALGSVSIPLGTRAQR
jgi:hypothetical protein